MGDTRMTPILALGTVAALLVLLFLLRSRDQGAQELEFGDMNRMGWLGSGNSLPPADLVARIFSRKDREFIELLGCPRLQRLYLAERQKISSHWVRQISLEVSQIMRRHRLSSRESPNLNVVAETRLFFQYVELRLLCEMLLFSIRLFGPDALANLASQAGELYQRIGQSLPGVAAQNPVEPSRNAAAT
jgi:hypothetical protein